MQKVKATITGWFWALALLMMAGGPAFANTPAPAIEYEELATGARNEVFTAVSAYAPVVVGLMAAMVALALLIRWVKRAAKSS